jgi:acyl-coenzyme A thioesterase PaaI-like protein
VGLGQPAIQPRDGTDFLFRIYTICCLQSPEYTDAPETEQKCDIHNEAASVSPGPAVGAGASAALAAAACAVAVAGAVDVAKISLPSN